VTRLRYQPGRIDTTYHGNSRKKRIDAASIFPLPWRGLPLTPSGIAACLFGTISGIVIRVGKLEQRLAELCFTKPAFLLDPVVD